MTTQEEIARLIHRVEARAASNLILKCETKPDGSLFVPPALADWLRDFSTCSFDDLSDEDRKAAMHAAATVIALIVDGASD